MGDNTEAAKHDDGKLRYDLIPAGPLRDIVAVFTFGAQKHEDNNWRKGKRWGSMYAAVQRHLQAFNNGQDLDEESGLPHLAHAAVGIMFLLEYMKTCPDQDDRVCGEKIDFMLQRLQKGYNKVMRLKKGENVKVENGVVYKQDKNGNLFFPVELPNGETLFLKKGDRLSYSADETFSPAILINEKTGRAVTIERYKFETEQA